MGICNICGKSLMLVRGREVYVEITDPIGNAVKVHKLCAKTSGNKEVTAQPGDIGQNIGRGYYWPREIED